MKTLTEYVSNVFGEAILKGKEEGISSLGNCLEAQGQGGLGVTNLCLQNAALLMKSLHKFYNQVEVPWVQLVWYKYYHNKVPHTAREIGSFRWKDIFRPHGLYCAIVHYTVGNGALVCF